MNTSFYVLTINIRFCVFFIEVLKVNNYWRKCCILLYFANLKKLSIHFLSIAEIVFVLSLTVLNKYWKILLSSNKDFIGLCTSWLSMIPFSFHLLAANNICEILVYQLYKRLIFVVYLVCKWPTFLRKPWIWVGAVGLLSYKFETFLY